jgi:hypothetical protein
MALAIKKLPGNCYHWFTKNSGVWPPQKWRMKGPTRHSSPGRGSLKRGCGWMLMRIGNGPGALIS